MNQESWELQFSPVGSHDKFHVCAKYQRVIASRMS